MYYEGALPGFSYSHILCEKYEFETLATYNHVPEIVQSLFLSHKNDVFISSRTRATFFPQG